MYIHDYGDWTRVYPKGDHLAPYWEPGHIEFASIGKKTFWGKEIEAYEHVSAYEHYTRGTFIKGYGETNRVKIPEFEIASNPTVRIRDVSRRRFDVIERYQKAIEKDDS